MPSSQQPSITAKPKGRFLQKMAEFSFSPSLKSYGAKSGLTCASNKIEPETSDSSNHKNKNNSDNNSSNKNNNDNRYVHSSSDSMRKGIECNVNSGEDNNTTNSRPNIISNFVTISSNNNKNNNINNFKDSGNSVNSDGNNNNLPFDSIIYSPNNQQILANHNRSRITNECATNCGETSLITSSHRQRLHHQVTKTSEMKTSCVKSDLSELKSSLSEMKNLNFANSKFKNSFENILDSTYDNSNGGSGNSTAEPLITYPESPTPSNSNGNIISFQSANDVISSRKNSIVTNDDLSCSNNCSSSSLASELKFEHTLKHRMLTSEDITQQQKQNISSSTLRMQKDSFSSEKKATAGQHIEILNGEKRFSHHTSRNFTSSTSVSHVKQFSNTSNNFLNNEIEEASTLARQTSISEHLSENFDDLNKLRINANQQEVEKAISKYSIRLQEVIAALNNGGKSRIYDVPNVLNKLSEMMSKAWLVPTYGHELGNSLCDVLRKCGGLDLLISNCDASDNIVKFSSAKLLEQCLTTENRSYVVNNGLEKVVQVACICAKNGSSSDYSRVSTGILEHLFKHSEGTCEDVIRLGGLDTILFECRAKDVETLRHCASALANLSLYGGADNQEAMIKRKVPVWLFPLAFHNDDNIKYYACLAISALVANKEIEAAVLKSGTLNLVEPFITTHSPSEFAKSNLAHAHGQSKNWLQRLVPVLSSKREEARNLAAFHFCMEAEVKKSQGNTKVFAEIGAIECLKKVASCPNAIASKYAAQALRLIGEVVPHKLIQQVPLWSVEDVKQWVIQIGFAEYSNNFEESRVDGDLLLQLTEENLRDDIGISNGIRRRRFTRELQNLKKMADYSSRDADNLNFFLQNIGSEFTAYTYSMLNAGVDKDSIRCLSQDQLLHECGITNSIHRLRILESVKGDNCFANNFQQDSEKLDVFISYRRSNGSQLASLLKVHLQVKNFSVFIDVEKLEAGKFDNNLLLSIEKAKNFVLVLTPNALDRCIGDFECKDWIHREIVAALQSRCNIIPIYDNFDWPEPEELPEDMRAICHFNGIKWIHDYQDACVEKLERFMKGEVSYKNLGQENYNRCLKNETSVMKNLPSYQRTQSTDSNKGSEG